jgi:hypothetical protein
MVIGMVVLLFCVGLSGCNEHEKLDGIRNRLVGEWSMLLNGTVTDTILIIYSNGSMISIAPEIGLSTPGTWELNDDKLIFHAENIGYYDTWEYNYYFSNNYNTLTTILVGSNHTVIYTRN